jgi:UPF0755 protein
VKLLLKALALLTALALLVAATALFRLNQWWESPNPLQHDVIITIAPGTSTQAILAMLEEAELTDSALFFRAQLALQQLGGTRPVWKAGEYLFAPGLSPAQLSDKLARGDVVAHFVTIPEGLNSLEITAILEADDRLSGDVPSIPEGSLLPDTWQIHRGDSRASVVERMRDAQQKLLAELWEAHDPALPYASPHDAVIMASVIEKETGIDGERDHVAGVFVNRLRLNMPLQSDPTVVYGIEKTEGPMKRALYRSDWKRDHPWNTYTRSGLPQGPVCHPGRAALEAAFHPKATQDLYFVATGTGGHYFAETLAEHNRNIARYRAQRRSAP